MKYYYREHILGYRKVRDQGKTAWAEIHGGEGFENFSSRGFLEVALPTLHFSSPYPLALEYGCGTGPGACYLAERGFRVDGIDLIPLAIEIAREQARLRGLEIHYAVQDICALPHDGVRYDLIVDSFCLQCIVSDTDRARVYAAVQARLGAEGYYLISTAIFDPGRVRQETVIDRETDIVYNRYGEDGLIDLRTSIVLKLLDDPPEDYEEAVKVGGSWYLPNRRHLQPPALRAELEGTGFRVLYQDGGHVVCVL
jgi:SAM-dependent methyltransferase